MTALTIGTLLLLDGIALVSLPEGDAVVLEQEPPTTGAPPVSVLVAATTLPPPPVDERELRIFLQPIATSADVRAVRKALEAMPDVLSIRFVDKGQAYEEMKVLFAENPDVMRNISPADAPVNFHVVPKPGADRDVIGARLKGYKNVLSVVYPGD